MHGRISIIFERLLENSKILVILIELQQMFRPFDWKESLGGSKYYCLILRVTFE